MSEFWFSVASCPPESLAAGVDMSEECWSGVWQTFIGSGLGFLLGMVAFWFQHRVNVRAKEKADWRAALDALNRLNMAAGANIEALANAKLQLIKKLEPDVERVKKTSESIFEMPPADREKRYHELAGLLAELRYFFMSVPGIEVMPPPEVREYSSLSKEMRALSLFVHRAVSRMQWHNDASVFRNTLLEGHASENGIGGGLSGDRLMYYSSMLAGSGEAICNSVDDAMYCWHLVIVQVKAYMTRKAEGEPFEEFDFPPGVIECLPKDDLFPWLQKQLVTFEE